MSLFFISIRSYLHTPKITSERPCPTSQISGTSKIKRIKNKSGTSLPFVSIIIPARNEQDTIERCILSLLNQDYPNFELIIVDDNSTDNTLKIVQETKVRIRGPGPGGGLPLSIERLKIISLTEKPEKWTGKTWASEQGYSHSTGNILLFTDADTYYMRKDTIYEAVSYMQKENLDVLTGLPFIELRDFWSKITMPLWNHFSILLGANTGAMNNPRSKVAYLMGSFFLIRKKVIEEVGSFRSVRNAIQEDRELGMRIKKAGYDMRIVRIDNAVSALWSRDLLTLWHGIGRTFAPMTKRQIFVSLITVFFMALLPFVLLPYTLSLTVNDMTATDTDWIAQQQEAKQLSLFSFYLNSTSCLMVIISTAIKDMKRYRMVPTYSLLCFLCAGLIVISYIAKIISLFSNLSWRGRILLTAIR
jgi:chlorobactene glucosyltransferase